MEAEKGKILILELPVEMNEVSRDYFLHNFELKPAGLFASLFSPPANYVYEVFRVDSGVPLFLDDHLERFYKTLELSGLNIEIAEPELRKQIGELIQNNAPEEGNIKIAGYQLPNLSPELFIYFTPHSYPTRLQSSEGVDTELFHAERENPNAKVMQTGMRKTADEIKQIHHVYEVLLVDKDGFVTEGSRSNVFFLKDNTLITPPADTVLEGITRKQILGLCKINNIPCFEHKVHQSSLSEYNGLFISGTSRRVLPVKRVNDMSFPVDHPLIGRLQELFQMMVETYKQQHK